MRIKKVGITIGDLMFLRDRIDICNNWLNFVPDHYVVILPPKRRK